MRQLRARADDFYKEITQTLAEESGCTRASLWLEWTPAHTEYLRQVGALLY